MKIEAAKRSENIGEYFFSKILKEIAEMKSKGANIINLGIGSPDLAPPQNAIDAIIETVNSPLNHAYQSYNGIKELRVNFANWYKKYYNVNLNYNTEILPLLGSKEGIFHISMAYLSSGDEVLIPNPSYPAYTSASILSGAKIKYYNLEAKNNWLPDLAEIEKQDLSQVKIMWVNYPNMPTGAQASKAFFDKLISFGKRHNILICNDNPYSFILNTNYLSILNSDGAFDIVLELNSLSKSHNLSGWRVGVLVGNSEFINTVLKVKSNIDSGMFLGIQQGAIKALENDNSWFEKLNVEYSIRRQLVIKMLEILDCKFDISQSGMFIWAKIPEAFKNSEQFSNYLLNTFQIFATPGIVFGSNGDKYIRFSLCAKQEQLIEALNRIKN